MLMVKENHEGVTRSTQSDILHEHKYDLGKNYVHSGGMQNGRLDFNWLCYMVVSALIVHRTSGHGQRLDECKFGDHEICRMHDQVWHQPVCGTFENTDVSTSS